MWQNIHYSERKRVGLGTTRGDYMKLDVKNWHCLTLSRRDPKTGKFTMEKAPLYHIVDEKK